MNRANGDVPKNKPATATRDAYAHPSLQPTADESWSTLPMPKRARGANAVKTSAKFKVPSGLVGRTVVRRDVDSGRTETEAGSSGRGEEGSYGAVKRTVVLYKPPPRDTKADIGSSAADGKGKWQEGSEGRRADVSSTAGIELSSASRLGRDNLRQETDDAMSIDSAPLLKIVHASTSVHPGHRDRASVSTPRRPSPISGANEPSMHALRSQDGQTHVNNGRGSPELAFPPSSPSGFDFTHDHETAFHTQPNSMDVDDSDSASFDLELMRTRYPEVRSRMREVRTGSPILLPPSSFLHPFILSSCLLLPSPCMIWLY